MSTFGEELIKIQIHYKINILFQIKNKKVIDSLHYFLDIIIEENEFEKKYRESSLNTDLISIRSGGIVSDINPHDKSIDIINKYTTITILNYYELCTTSGP